MGEGRPRGSRKEDAAACSGKWLSQTVSPRWLQPKDPNLLLDQKPQEAQKTPLTALPAQGKILCISPEVSPGCCVCASAQHSQKSCPLTLHLTSWLPPGPRRGGRPCYSARTWQGRTGHWTHHVCPSCYSEEVATIMRTDTEVGLLRLGFLQLQQLLLKNS